MLILTERNRRVTRMQLRIALSGPNALPDSQRVWHGIDWYRNPQI